jgi:hypothetical protein
VLEYSHVHVAQSDLTTAARYMFWLMFRNVASDGLVFDDPVNAGIISSPGAGGLPAPYDPNIDIAASAIYGAESVTDPRGLRPQPTSRSSTTVSLP